MEEVVKAGFHSARSERCEALLNQIIPKSGGPKAAEEARAVPQNLQKLGPRDTSS